MLLAGGHDVVIGSAVAIHTSGLMLAVNHNGLILGGRPPEIVILQRWMGHEAATEIRAARAAGQVIISDVDDWFWGLDPANQAHRNTSKQLNALDNRDHYRRAVEACDAVTVSSHFLAKRIKERFGVPTLVVRNAIDRRVFTPNMVRPVSSELVVGWVGALGWRSGDLETLAGVLGPYLDATNSTFTHRGTFPGDDPADSAATRLGLSHGEVTTQEACVPWEYPDLLEDIDIGIVPLADVPFNQAKSWIKGLEYAAAGIPFVAARTLEYELLGAGILASTPAEWRAGLDRLTDPAERAKVRAYGFEAAARADLNTRWRDWERAYEALLGRHATPATVA